MSDFLCIIGLYVYVVVVMTGRQIKEDGILFHLSVAIFDFYETRREICLFLRKMP